MNIINVELIKTFFNDKPIDNPNKIDYKQELREKNQKLMNVINICDEIKTIPDYKYYYSIIVDYSPVKIGNITNKQLNSLDYVQNDKQYILVTIEKKEYINVNILLKQIKPPKMIVFNAIHTYSNLLDSLLKLNEKALYFLNLYPENILINDFGNPLLKGFEKSIKNPVSSSKQDMMNSIRMMPNKPLEAHILLFLFNNPSLSDEHLEPIYNLYTTSHTYLRFFSQKYKDYHKKETYDVMNAYKNRSFDDVYDGIVKSIETWDNYCLSLIYIYIIGCITSCFSLNDTITSEIIKLLSININPEPSKRQSLKVTKRNYEAILAKHNDWSFTNNISYALVDKFRELLC